MRPSILGFFTVGMTTLSMLSVSCVLCKLGPLSSGQGKMMPFVDPDRIEQSDRVQAASFAPFLRCHHCLHLALGKCSGISRHATIPLWLRPACTSSTTSVPAPTQPTIAMTKYTHASNFTNSSAFHTQLYRF